MDKLPIGYIVKQVQHAFRKKMDSALATDGVTYANYAVLFHLANGECLSSADLARACWVTPQTMHRLITDMKKRGFILPLDEPGRAVRLKISEAGLQRFEGLKGRIVAIERQMVGSLEDGEIEQLRRQLLLCLEGLNSNP